MANSNRVYDLVLGVVDVLLARIDASEVEPIDRLTRMDELLRLIDLRIGDLSAQILASEVGAVTAARNQLARFREQQTTDPAQREDERRDVIDASDLALQRVLEQADVLIAPGTGGTELAVAMAAVDYALLARLEVAATLEAGPLGSAGLREAVAFAAALGARAGPAFDRPIREAITFELEPADLPQLRVVATSALTGNRLESEPFSPADIIGQIEARARLADALYALDAETIGIAILLQNAGAYEELALGSDILGTPGPDFLEGGDFEDAIRPFGPPEPLPPGNVVAFEADGTARSRFENDFLAGLGGDDTLEGGAGDDGLRGDNGNDVLRGEDGSDLLFGGAGDDTLEGGPGTDIARYAGLSSQYTITGGTAGARVEGPDGSDSLTGVERVLFDDSEVPLGEGGLPEEPDPGGGIPDAQVIAYLYGAAFDRDPDIPGLNFWIDEFEDGLDVLEIAFFMATEPGGEFEQLYGPFESLPTRAYVTLLYQNTLDRVPDGDGFEFWVRVLDEGLRRSDAVFYFSESPEYRAGNAALVETLAEVSPGFWDFA